MSDHTTCWSDTARRLEETAARRSPGMKHPRAVRPPYGAFTPFGPFVVLTVTVTVNGEEATAQQQVGRAAWQPIAADPGMRAAYEQRLHHRLVDALVERLAPAVTVHDSSPAEEAVSAALAYADAAMRSEPEPGHVRPSN